MTLLLCACGGATTQPASPPCATATTPPLAASSAPAPVAATPATPYSGHGVASVPKEVLARFAPVPIAHDVSRRIQAMLDLRGPGLGSVTPDGKSLVFPWNVTGTWQVWRSDGPRGFPVQLTGGEDPARPVALTPDGRMIVVSRDRKGEENPGLYLLELAGGQLRVIQHKAGVQTRFEFVTDDSKAVYYTANDVKKDSYAVYRFDIATGRAEQVFGQEGLWRAADHRPDGTLLLARQTGALTREYSEYDPASKTLTPLFGQGEAEEYSAAYGPSSGEFFVLTPKLGEFRRLYRWTLKDKKLEPVSPDARMDVAGFSLDRQRKRVYYTLNDGGYTRLRVIDARTLKEESLPTFPEADHVVSGPASSDGRYVAIGVGTSQGPMRSHVWDWKTRKLVEWVVPSTPEIDTTRFASAKLETYPARDGTPIPMFVRRPSSCEEPCPVVVHFHGGPEGQSRPGFSALGQLFVDAGFVFAEPNVRGSDGYGKTWVKADDGVKRQQVLTDIEDCSRHIRSAWAKDGKAPRIGVLGGSYGGYATLAAMTIFAGAYDAGVADVAIGNLLTFLQNTAPYRRALRISEYGDPERDRDVLLQLSPVTHVGKVRAPLMLIHGATDPRVPVGEAIQFHDALVARGVTTRLVVFPDEGHGTQKRDNRVLEYGYMLEFLERHLKGTSSH